MTLLPSASGMSNRLMTAVNETMAGAATAAGMGRTQNARKLEIHMKETYNSMSEIVGEESLFGKVMQTGSILDMIDVLAGKISYGFCRESGAHSVTTLAFDRVDMLHPIHHGDLILLEGRVILAGKSSMVIEIQGFRQDMLSRTFIPVQSCHVLMVAIDKNGRPFKNVPTLLHDTPDELEAAERYKKRQALTSQWLKAQDEVSQKFLTRTPSPTTPSTTTTTTAVAHSSSGGSSSTEDEEDKEGEEEEKEENNDRHSQGLNLQELLSIRDTKVVVRRTFFPRHINVNNTIFGGDILLWMDRCATHTARSFTRNRNVFTISMNRVFFKHPIYISDWVEMTARVVDVRLFTLEVEIEVVLERQPGKRISSHSGYFTVLNCDEAGFRRPILTGLRELPSLAVDPTSMDEETRQDTLRRLRARARREFFRKYEASPSMAALHGFHTVGVRHLSASAASAIKATSIPFFEWKGKPHSFPGKRVINSRL